MKAILIILSIVEIGGFVAVVALYLMKLSASLDRTAKKLTQTSAGVKAVEGHCAPIGSVVTKVNAQLGFISKELGVLAGLTRSVTTKLAQGGPPAVLSAAPAPAAAAAPTPSRGRGAWATRSPQPSRGGPRPRT